ncbi:hypothetical protein LX36DRAFT_753021 [Colletotrichum falcatum]|nr:hypothetical protein LX36DRAFT_753021 [Colletotrichum falcatum]
MVQPKPASSQQPSPASARNANIDKAVLIARNIPGVTSLKTHSATSGATRQRPVASVSNGPSTEPRNSKRAFIAVDQDHDSHGPNHKRSRVAMQGSNQDKDDPRNDEIPKGSNCKSRDWLAEDGLSIKREMLEASRGHADVSYISSRPVQHTSKIPNTTTVQPITRRLIRWAVEEDPVPKHPSSTIERVSTDLASVNKTIGTRSPDDESIRSVIDGIKETVHSNKGLLDKQQTDAKVAQGFEAINQQLMLLNNESAVLRSKMNACEMGIASLNSDVGKRLTSVSERVDNTTSSIGLIQTGVVKIEHSGETVQTFLEALVNELEEWKEEVVIPLKGKEEGRDLAQRISDLETRLAGNVQNAAETVKGALDQLNRAMDKGINASILILDTHTKVHHDECAAKDVEIGNLRAEVGRLAKENQDLEKKNQAGAAAIAALLLERDGASSEAKSTAEEAEALRRKLGALEEERSKWKAAAMESHSAVSTKLVETLGKVQSGLREDFQAGNALVKTARLSDIDSMTRFETTIKALMEKNLQVERDRHEEVMRAVKDNAVEQKESWRGSHRSDSAGTSDREVFDEVLKSPWAWPTVRTVRNLAKFAVTHDKRSRESLGHSVVYRNIVPYMSGRGCTQAFEAFLGYSQPGSEYCLFAVLEKKDGEAASADGRGKTYIVLNPETS